MLQLIANIIAR